MIIKKSNGKIFGAELTAAERKAMRIELQKEAAEMNRKNAAEIDAVILWIMHEEFGFGHKRLKRFYDKLVKGVRELNERYETDYDEQVWLCTQKLLEYGIDIQKWNEESK